MIRILTFHEIHNPKWFENVIGYLKSNYEMTSIEGIHDFCNHSLRTKELCHITVDDGQNSFHDTIYPILKKHNVPVTLFVSPGILANGSNYWFQEIKGYDHARLKKCIADVASFPLDDLAKFNVFSILKTLPICQIEKVIEAYQSRFHVSKKAGQNISLMTLKELDQCHLVTIGAHTMNHPILANESDSTSRFEIQESVSELSAILNHPVKYFAYPNGQPGWDYSEREISYVKEAGVDLAFNTEAKNMSSADKSFSIPRFGITDGERMHFLKLKLLLGSLWQPIRRLKANGEFRERKLLRRIRRPGFINLSLYYSTYEVLAIL